MVVAREIPTNIPMTVSRGHMAMSVDLKKISRSIALFFTKAVVALGCLLGVLALSASTVDQIYETELVYNEDYDPNAKPEYGEVCSYSDVYGEQCSDVLYNAREYAKTYYVSFSQTWGYYGFDDHSEFFDKPVPTNPYLFFSAIYGALFYIRVRQIRKDDRNN
jgi:hypothetical protein